MGQPRPSRTDNPPPSPHAPLSGSSTADGSAMGVVEGANSISPRQRRRRRRGGKPVMDTTMDESADFTEATASIIACYFLKPDPLVKAMLCECADLSARLVLVDPMMDKLDPLLAATRLATARAPDCLYLKGQVLLWDSTLTTPLGTAESPLSSHVHGAPI
ncbi:hypothetical protein SORBI_3001G538275 [Sorghum bicolor]|uniref:Uncharacterized protein n=1 Tax=Sorghum bicolor TaxID=4558 RepID=A0A1Z5SBY7_SORBI|nr:hypothetical protein SORBI_3001G538275 [Sorghum bicolor]